MMAPQQQQPQPARVKKTPSSAPRLPQNAAAGDDEDLDDNSTMMAQKQQPQPARVKKTPSSAPRRPQNAAATKAGI